VARTRSPGNALAEMWAVGKTYYPEAGELYSSLSRELGGTDNQGNGSTGTGAFPTRR